MAKKAMYGPKQKLLIHAAKGYFEPKVPNASRPRNGHDPCRVGFSVAEFRSESNLIVPPDLPATFPISVRHQTWDW